MIKPIFFTSEGNNSYVYSPQMNQFLLIHPVIAYYLKLKKEGIEPVTWLKDFNLIT